MAVVFTCLLLDNAGELLGNPFVLRSTEDQYLSDVAVLIQERRIDIRVPADLINFWKANPPFPDSSLSELSRRVKALHLNVMGNEREAMPLKTTDQLGDIFPPHLSLPPNHIHIIAQLRTTTVSPLRSPTPTFDIEEIDQLIEKELVSLRVVVEDFLKNPDPPIWDPPDHATPRDREFLAALQIPTYDNGRPSLLFHDLHVRDVDEVKKRFGSHKHLFVCNTSGSGKTRRILECLTMYWGFYFVAAPDTNGVGALDLHDALGKVLGDRKWTPDLRLVDAKERASKSRDNSLIASMPLKKVLAARIVIFRLFLELAIKADKKLEEKHKRSWLFLQLSQSGPSASHLFLRIIRKCLYRASNDALDKLIERLIDIRQDYMPRTHFIVGVDEAQRAVRSFRHSFVSSTSDKVYRTILREIVKVFSVESIKLVVSGTGVTMGDLRDSVASGVSKPDAVELYHDLGMFDTWEKLRLFLERYLPLYFLETKSGRHLQKRMQEYLLGRYRFSVSFLECFLQNGLKSPHKLLNEYIKAHISPGQLGGGTSLPFTSNDPDLGVPNEPDLSVAFTSNEPDLHVEVTISGFEWDRLKDDLASLHEAADIVTSHVTRGATPTYGKSLQLVEYGIARLRKLPEGHQGQIIEPLAFLSLMQWLRQPDVGHSSLITTLKSRLASGSSRGYGLEEVAILFLLRALRFPVRLSSIFEFYGTPPKWADDDVQIVGHLDGEPVPVDVLGDRHRNPGLCSVQYGANIKEILDWIIKDRTTTPAVLVPCTSFGPDVLVWCGNVLLMGQVKSSLSGNKDGTQSATTTSSAIDSLHEDHWFKDVTESEQIELRQRLIDTIRQHNVVRFVTSYPLFFDLDSTAQSVMKAITTLGPNVALANIPIDQFRTTFVAENIAALLEPLESAYGIKKKHDNKRKVEETGSSDRNRKRKEQRKRK